MEKGWKKVLCKREARLTKSSVTKIIYLDFKEVAGRKDIGQKDHLIFCYIKFNHLRGWGILSSQWKIRMIRTIFDIP